MIGSVQKMPVSPPETIEKNAAPDAAMQEPENVDSPVIRIPLQVIRTAAATIERYARNARMPLSMQICRGSLCHEPTRGSINTTESGKIFANDFGPKPRSGRSHANLI